MKVRVLAEKKRFPKYRVLSDPYDLGEVMKALRAFGIKVQNLYPDAGDTVLDMWKPPVGVELWQFKKIRKSHLSTWLSRLYTDKWKVSESLKRFLYPSGSIYLDGYYLDFNELRTEVSRFGIWCSDNDPDYLILSESPLTDIQCREILGIPEDRDVIDLSTI